MIVSSAGARAHPATRAWCGARGGTIPHSSGAQRGARTQLPPPAREHARARMRRGTACVPSRPTRADSDPRSVALACWLRRWGAPRCKAATSMSLYSSSSSSDPLSSSSSCSKSCSIFHPAHAHHARRTASQSTLPILSWIYAEAPAPPRLSSEGRARRQQARRQADDLWTAWCVRPSTS